MRLILDEAIRRADAAANDLPAPTANFSTCCCGSSTTLPSVPVARQDPAHSVAPLAVTMQDQDGATFTFGDFFGGYISAVVFFYTRCENPQKCSLTITNLARLQRLIAAHPSLQDIRLAAVTYDPAFDTPERLKAYGRDRGITFDQRTKLLRTVGALAPLADFFELGVSYGESTVNIHRTELAVLDRSARIAKRFVRQIFQPEHVFATIEDLFLR